MNSLMPWPKLSVERKHVWSNYPSQLRNEKPGLRAGLHQHKSERRIG